MPLHLLLFAIILVLRDTRKFINGLSFWTTPTTDPPLKNPPKHTPQDVSVILPTVHPEPSFLKETLLSILSNNPLQLIIVIPDGEAPSIAALRDALARWKASTRSSTNILTLTIPHYNKRLQMMAGVARTAAPITVFADDDVVWHRRYLTILLTAFDDPAVGAAGTNQRVRRRSGNVFNILGVAYLERRNYNAFGTNRIDGGVSTLSGRTAAYRTAILQAPWFGDFFLKDRRCGGRVDVKIGDDKRLTRAVFRRGWKIRLVYSTEAFLATTLEEDGARFLGQCLRWARAHWQGNVAVVAGETYWCRRQPWSAYATYFGSVMTPAVAVDWGLWWLLRRGLDDVEEGVRLRVLLGYVVWTLMLKNVKMLGHFRREPGDVVWIPALTLFCYLHGFINVYALLTMWRNSWGGKALPKVAVGGVRKAADVAK